LIQFRRSRRFHTASAELGLMLFMTHHWCYALHCDIPGMVGDLPRLLGVSLCDRNCG
jgi:hypothetical protein